MVPTRETRSKTMNKVWQYVLGYVKSHWVEFLSGVAILRDTRVNPDNRGDASHVTTQTNLLDVC